MKNFLNLKKTHSLTVTIFLCLSSYTYSQNLTETSYSSTSNVESLEGVSYEIKQLFYKIDIMKQNVGQENYLQLINLFNDKFISQFQEFPNENIFINNDLLYKWLKDNSQQSTLYYKIIYEFYIQLERSRQYELQYIKED
jgi:hypothetical protein